MAGVADRLARLWQMVADLDPELSRRMAGYRGAKLEESPRTAKTVRRDHQDQNSAVSQRAFDSFLPAFSSLEFMSVKPPGDTGAPQRGQ